MEGSYGSIDADYYLCHCYYIIEFYSSSYTLQADLSIDDWVIFPVKCYGKELIFFQSIPVIMFFFTNN